MASIVWLTTTGTNNYGDTINRNPNAVLASSDEAFFSKSNNTSVSPSVNACYAVCKSKGNAALPAFLPARSEQGWRWRIRLLGEPL
jgi:hypothetical protein